jgi:hypothetical protein
MTSKPRKKEKRERKPGKTKEARKNQPKPTFYVAFARRATHRSGLELNRQLGGHSKNKTGFPGLLPKF